MVHLLKFSWENRERARERESDRERSTKGGLSSVCEIESCKGVTEEPVIY